MEDWWRIVSAMKKPHHYRPLILRRRSYARLIPGVWSLISDLYFGCPSAGRHPPTSDYCPMVDDLQTLTEALSFFEMEQNSVMVPLGAWTGDTESEGFFLVGRLLSRRSYNFEALKNTLINSFNAIKGLDIRLIENERFLFKFAHTIDRKRVIDGGPWAFEKNLLVLKIVENDDDPASIDLDWVDFSVHVHGLPLGRMSRSMAEVIGNQLGKFQDIEQVSGGHIMKFCECQYEAGFDEKRDPLPFGPWLRATTPNFLRSRGVTNSHPPPSFVLRNQSELTQSDTPRRGPAIFQYMPTSQGQPSIPTQPQTSQMYLNIAPRSQPYNQTLLLHNPTTNTLPQTPANPTTPMDTSLPVHHTTSMHTIPLIPSNTSHNTIPPVAYTLLVPQPLHTPEPSPTIKHPLHQTLSDVPLVFSAATHSATTLSQSSSTTSRGRKKQAPRKVISITKKRKLIDETLDASESP
ncbi:hypothetical protein Salat_1657300 [Sesamum alatum]|uniref:DUF4283 domain-containing protein n=1 Tax=Sesamum alatum TaxID=300844 RepID=A0AAE2CJN0_9LAMI|nr:hypothetical protein Salat_1657300 [Sesamum alatum]